MRKLMYIIAGIILTIGMSSCEKQGGIPNNDMGMGLIKGVTVEIPEIGYIASAPVSSMAGAVPYLIEGKNKGGNRTCEEAKVVYEKLFPAILEVGDCTGKVDIDDDYVGFVDAFPFEVEILSDGTLRFDTGDPECKVFAVIVKGSNQANVYLYDDGAVEDAGLTPPPFDPEADNLRFPWISNITFCCACIPDQPDDGRIGFKVYYTGGAGGQGYSVGDAYWSGIGWCNYLRFSDYPDVSPISVWNYFDGTIGSATVTPGHVTITLDSPLVITKAYLFVGDSETVLDATDCPEWDPLDPGWLEMLEVGSNTVTFDF